MNKELALKALKLLDEKLKSAHFEKVHLTIGGGGAMMLHHGFNGATVDIDAVPINLDFELLKPYMQEVAQELKIAPDWLNPYYQTFTIYLPSDAKSRTEKVFEGDVLLVNSLGAEEVLIMKLMAGRRKDMAHIKHLLKKKVNLQIVSSRLEELKKLYPKLAMTALDLLDEFIEEMTE